VVSIVREGVRVGVSSAAELRYRTRTFASQCQQWFKWRGARPDQGSAEFWNWPEYDEERDEAAD